MLESFVEKEETIKRKRNTNFVLQPRLLSEGQREFARGIIKGEALVTDLTREL